MDRLETIRTFTRVAEAGNFSRVAREENIGQPTISKHVAWLESYLGVQLLHRNARAVRLTEAGQTFYESASRLLADLEAAEGLVGRGAAKASGRLSVTLSAGFGRQHIVPLLGAFRDRYPDITIELLTSDRFVDLLEEGIDVAIRIGQLADSTLVARRIGSSPRVTVTTPAYLSRVGTPLFPGDIEPRDCIVYTFQRSPNSWIFRGPDGPIEVRPSGAIRTNDAEIIRDATLAGLGLVQAPRWLFSAELASGAVTEILSDYSPEPTPIHAVFRPGRMLAPKVRAFVDFIADSFMQDRSLRPT